MTTFSTIFLPQIAKAFGVYSLTYLALDYGELFEKLFQKLFRNPVPREIKVEWCIRCLSTLNCLFTMTSTLTEFLSHPELFEDILNGKTDNIVRVAGNFIGYIVYDTLVTLFHFKDLGFASVFFHHFLMIAIGFFGNYFDTFYPIGAIWTLNEISTVGINMNWFFTRMEEVNKAPVHSVLLLLNRILIYASFLFFRVLLHGYVDTKVMKTVLIDNPDTYSPPVKVFSATLVPAFGLLNLYWFGLLNKKYIKVLTGQGTIVEKGGLD